MLPQTELAFIKHYARGFLARRGESPDFVEAVVKFTSAEFYRWRSVGNYDYHLSKAQEFARELGLSESAINRIHETTTTIFLSYNRLTPEEYKTELQRRLNTRTRQDEISLGIGGIGTERLLSYAAELLDKDNPLKRRVGNDLWITFTNYVYCLLSGQQLSRDEVQSTGLNPDEVKHKATRILRNYEMKETERRQALRNPSPNQLRVRTRRGTNPIAFEEGWERRR